MITRKEKATEMLRFAATKTEADAYVKACGGNLSGWIRHMANQAAGVPLDRTTLTNKPHRKAVS